MFAVSWLPLASEVVKSSTGRGESEREIKSNIPHPSEICEGWDEDEDTRTWRRFPPLENYLRTAHVSLIVPSFCMQIFFLGGSNSFKNKNISVFTRDQEYSLERYMIWPHGRCWLIQQLKNPRHHSHRKWRKTRQSVEEWGRRNEMK